MTTERKRRGPIGWLAARTWRFWLLTTIGLPVFYVLSFGPACWMAAAARPPVRGESPPVLMRFYFPIGALIHRTQSQNAKAVLWWTTLGIKKGARVIVPTDASGQNFYGFTAER